MYIVAIADPYTDEMAAFGNYFLIWYLGPAVGVGLAIVTWIVFFLMGRR